MSKLTYENKIEIHQKKKQGFTKISLAKEYGVNISIIDYIYRVIEKHGYDILRTNKNKYYLSYQKEQINDMLNKGLVGKNLEGLIFHSDQGWQYQHQSYQKD